MSQESFNCAFHVLFHKNFEISIFDRKFLLDRPLRLGFDKTRSSFILKFLIKIIFFQILKSPNTRSSIKSIRS